VKQSRHMVLRPRADRWFDWVDQDTGEVLWSFQAPEGGFTVYDLERFRDHVLNVLEERERKLEQN